MLTDWHHGLNLDASPGLAWTRVAPSRDLIGTESAWGADQDGTTD